MESWVSLGGKEDHTKIQISGEPGINMGTLWSEDRDLSNYANHAHQPLYLKRAIANAPHWHRVVEVVLKALPSIPGFAETWIFVWPAKAVFHPSKVG